MTVKFTHLKLENWRNFREVDLPLRERMFVVGPNASGKTNLLDAFKFLRDIARAQGGLAAAVNSRGGFGKIRSLHAHGKDRHLSLEVTLQQADDTWTYALELSGRPSEPALVEHESVTRNGELVMERPNADDKKDRRLREQTHLEQLTQNASFRALADALAHVSHAHVVPQVAKTFVGTDEWALRDAPGSDFIARIAALKPAEQKKSLRKIERPLKHAVPQFSKLQIVRERSTGKPHLEARFEHWRAKGSWQNEQEFSDGTLRLIGLLWAIFDRKDPLLLEEPELSLHEEVVKKLPGMFARASNMQGRQIIVSTHSQHVLDDEGIDPREIILLTPSGQETTADLASNDESVLRAAQAGLPLGQIVSTKTRPSHVDQLLLAL